MSWYKKATNSSAQLICPFKMSLYSTQNLSDTALTEIKEALDGLKYGSVEIHVTAGQITQISKRIIKKTAESYNDEIKIK
jgi:hypothetical protein